MWIPSSIPLLERHPQNATHHMKQRTLVEELEMIGTETVREVIQTLLLDDLVYVRYIHTARPSLFSDDDALVATVLPATGAPC